MGEIKSTLDLVMERTRHLSMSAEEKAQQQRNTYEKRLQGLLQQYADGGLDLPAVAERIAALGSELGIEDPSIRMAAILGRIDPDGEAGPWVALATRYSPGLGPAAETVIDEHRSKRAALLKVGRQQDLARLAETYGISGSAVVPRPESSPACREALENLVRESRSRIASLSRQGE